MSKTNEAFNSLPVYKRLYRAAQGRGTTKVTDADVFVYFILKDVYLKLNPKNNRMSVFDHWGEEHILRYIRHRYPGQMRHLAPLPRNNNF